MPVLVHCLRAFLAVERVEAIYVAVRGTEMERVRAQIAEFGLGDKVQVVEGGDQRQQSVSNALAQLVAENGCSDDDVVLVHDAARPLIDAGTIERTIDAVAEHGAAIVALPAVDTIKQVERTAHGAIVTATIPRERIVQAQTPQGARCGLLRRASPRRKRMSSSAPTRPACWSARESWWPWCRARPRTSRSPSREIWNWPSSTCEQPRAGHRRGRTMSMRIGYGFDSHAFQAGVPLVIGGLAIEHSEGLAGHSDGDVLLHAITDALLGAVSAGDIGTFFPPSDPRWKGAASSVFLQTALEEVATAGYRIVNIDTVLVMARPKIVAHCGRAARARCRAAGDQARRSGHQGEDARRPGAGPRGHGALHRAAGEPARARGAGRDGGDRRSWSEEELNAVVEGLVGGRRDLRAGPQGARLRHGRSDWLIRPQG